MSLGTFGGVKTFKISTLVRGPREQQRLQNAATGLDASVARIGLLQFPVVRITRKGNEVIFGEHRVTAAETAGEASVECRTWAGTDEEADDLRREENLRRKHWTPEEIAAAVRRAEAVIVGKRAIAAAPETRSFDHLPTASKSMVTPTSRERGQAREAIAKITGKTTEGVRAAEQRAKPEKPETTQAEELLADLDTWGIAVSGAYAAYLGELDKAMDEVDLGLRKAQAEITRLEKGGYLSAVQAQGIRNDLHRAAHAVRQEKPAAICGYCKDPMGAAGRRKDCAGCWGLGWLSVGALGNMPKELRATADALVSVNGKLLPVNGNNAPVAKLPPVQRRLKIEMPDGRRFDPEVT